MSSPASIAKHPVHPMFIVFPLGLWMFSVVCDIVYLSGGSYGWAQAAFYCIGGGIVGALLAAVPGFIDWLSIRDPHVRAVGLWHMAINLGALVLFAINLFWRANTAPSSAGPFVLSLIAAAGLFVSGWLGGSLVYVHKVAVETRAGAGHRVVGPGEVAA